MHHVLSTHGIHARRGAPDAAVVKLVAAALQAREVGRGCHTLAAWGPTERPTCQHQPHQRARQGCKQRWFGRAHRRGRHWRVPWRLPVREGCVEVLEEALWVGEGGSGGADAARHAGTQSEDLRG